MSLRVWMMLPVEEKGKREWADQLMKETEVVDSFQRMSLSPARSIFFSSSFEASSSSLGLTGKVLRWRNHRKLTRLGASEMEETEEAGFRTESG
jgi:hypothetical protein